MKSFTRGLLIGVGIGFLFAPLTGEQMRHLLAERFNEFRDSLPEDSVLRPLRRYSRQIRESVEFTKENLRGYAQQAVSKAKDTSSLLSSKAMQTGQDMAQKAKQTSQDMAQKTKQTSQDMAQKAKHSLHTESSSSSSTQAVPESAGAPSRE